MKKSVCLNMIVKNEANVICRCIESIYHLIDSWVIVDTGSTDGTQHLIVEALKELPGELYERPWVDFATNRNEALALARGKGDYFLFIDADDWLQINEGFEWPDLTKDCYYVRQISKRGERELINQVVLLIRDLADFRWVGVMHEALFCETEKECEVLEGVVNVYGHDGARAHDPKIYENEIAMLESALKTKSDPRYLFYLARSYAFAEQYEQAFFAYFRRTQMEGREDERFYSFYMMGVLSSFLQKPFAEKLHWYCRAFQLRPSRAEPLFELKEMFQRDSLLSFLLTRFWETVPLVETDLFVESQKYFRTCRV